MQHTETRSDVDVKKYLSNISLKTIITSPTLAKEHTTYRLITSDLHKLINQQLSHIQQTIHHAVSI